MIFRTCQQHKMPSAFPFDRLPTELQYNIIKYAWHNAVSPRIIIRLISLGTFSFQIVPTPLANLICVNKLFRNECLRINETTIQLASDRESQYRVLIPAIRSLGSKGQMALHQFYSRADVIQFDLSDARHWQPLLLFCQLSQMWRNNVRKIRILRDKGSGSDHLQDYYHEIVYDILAHLLAVEGTLIND